MAATKTLFGRPMASWMASRLLGVGTVVYLCAWAGPLMALTSRSQSNASLAFEAFLGVVSTAGLLGFAYACLGFTLFSKRAGMFGAFGFGGALGVVVFSGQWNLWPFLVIDFFALWYLLEMPRLPAGPVYSTFVGKAWTFMLRGIALVVLAFLAGVAAVGPWFKWPAAPSKALPSAFGAICRSVDVGYPCRQSADT